MTEPVENHPCDQCGQLDNHPMIHVYEETYHFDCLPMRYRNQIAVGDQHAVTRAAIDAAHKGTHGDDLRKFIQKQKTDNNVEPTGHSVVPGFDTVPQTNVEA